MGRGPDFVLHLPPASRFSRPVACFLGREIFLAQSTSSNPFFFLFMNAAIADASSREVDPEQPAPTREDIARHYDQLDRFYRELWGEHVHHGFWASGRESPEEAARALVDVVAARARIAPKSNVVDIGCGYGATARLLALERLANVVGYTISQAQYWYAQGQETARKNAQEEQALIDEEENPRIILGDWLHNDLPDASQDAVVAIESVEHMADKPAVFGEVARVLRPEGRLVVCAWTAARDPKPWQRRRLLDPICREGRLAGLDREEDYVGWMTSAGLSVTGRDDVTDRVAKTWSICARRLLFGLVTQPRYLKFLMDGRNDSRSFAKTLPRLWLAYRTGALRYVIYTAYKPPVE
jgi:Cyclopropane fatty acid synthase and related methyltransferases